MSAEEGRLDPAWTAPKRIFSYQRRLELVLMALRADDEDDKSDQDFAEPGRAWGEALSGMLKALATVTESETEWGRQISSSLSMCANQILGINNYWAPIEESRKHDAEKQKKPSSKTIRDPTPKVTCRSDEDYKALGEVVEKTLVASLDCHIDPKRPGKVFWTLADHSTALVCRSLCARAAFELTKRADGDIGVATGLTLEGYVESNLSWQDLIDKAWELLCTDERFRAAGFVRLL